MGESDNGPVVVRAQQSERVTDRESLSLQRVVAERFSLEASVTATLAVFQPSMPAR